MNEYHDYLDQNLHNYLFLHGKTFFIEGQWGAAMVGSSNFTHAGLSTNLELNLFSYDPPERAAVKEWFDEIWEEAGKFREVLQDSGEWEKQRQKQSKKWMWSMVEEGMLKNFHNYPDIQKQITKLEKEVESGKMLPTTAARKLLDFWHVG